MIHVLTGAALSVLFGKIFKFIPLTSKVLLEVSVRSLIGYLFLITDQKNNEPYFWWELAGLMSSGKILKLTIFLFLPGWCQGDKKVVRWDRWCLFT